MPEETKDSQAKKVQESKGISRRQFIIGTSSGAVSVGVFGNALAQFLSSVASNMDSMNKKQLNNKQQSEKKKPN